MYFYGLVIILKSLFECKKFIMTLSVVCIYTKYQKQLLTTARHVVGSWENNCGSLSIRFDDDGGLLVRKTRENTSVIRSVYCLNGENICGNL